jgi:hypothetical protein
MYVDSFAAAIRETEVWLKKIIEKGKSKKASIVFMTDGKFFVVI